MLFKVDDFLRYKGYNFYRYIDDYTAYTKTREQAEMFMHDLQQQLSKYKLSLNMKKCEISMLPQPEKEAWVIDLQAIAQSLPRNLAPSQVAQFIDQITVVAETHDSKNVYKYAASILHDRTKSGHPSVTAFVGLLGLCDHSPNLVCALRHFIPSVAEFTRHSLLNPLLQVLQQSLFFRRTDNACWCMYYLNSVGYVFEGSIARDILATRDCLPILLLYAYGSKSAKKDVIDFAKKALAAPDMHDRHAYWLLIYELFRVGALKKAGVETAQFSMMKGAGVKFCSAV